MKKLDESILRKIEKQVPTYERDSAILGVFEIEDGYLIHNELVLIRCSKDGGVKWYSDFHKDVISSVNIKGRIIEVTEFENADHYLLDLDTACLVDPRGKITGKEPHHHAVMRR